MCRTIWSYVMNWFYYANNGHYDSSDSRFTNESKTKSSINNKSIIFYLITSNVSCSNRIGQTNDVIDISHFRGTSTSMINRFIKVLFWLFWFNFYLICTHNFIVVLLFVSAFTESRIVSSWQWLLQLTQFSHLMKFMRYCRSLACIFCTSRALVSHMCWCLNFSLSLESFP